MKRKINLNQNNHPDNKFLAAVKEHNVLVNMTVVQVQKNVSSVAIVDHPRQIDVTDIATMIARARGVDGTGTNIVEGHTLHLR